MLTCDGIDVGKLDCVSENWDSDTVSARTTPSPATLQVKGVCTLSSNEAVRIFLAAKHGRTKRDRLALRLAHDFGITPKAVRDIWNLRTWARTTKPYWSPSDFLKGQPCTVNKDRSRKLTKTNKTQKAAASAISIDLPKDCGFTSKHVPSWWDSLEDFNENACRNLQAHVHTTAIGQVAEVANAPVQHGDELPSSEASTGSVQTTVAPPALCPILPDTTEYAYGCTLPLRTVRGVPPAAFRRAAIVPNSEPESHCNYEWMVEPRFIAQAFEAIHKEWKL